MSPQQYEKYSGQVEWRLQIPGFAIEVAKGIDNNKGSSFTAVGWVKGVRRVPHPKLGAVGRLDSLGSGGERHLSGVDGRRRWRGVELHRAAVSRDGGRRAGCRHSSTSS